MDNEVIILAQGPARGPSRSPGGPGNLTPWTQPLPACNSSRRPPLRICSRSPGSSGPWAARTPDATEVLFLAQHPPGQVCSACRLKPRQSSVSGQITTVSRVNLDLLTEDAYAAYEVIPGEIAEPKVIVDVDHEIEEACEAIREWGGP